jgi:hypothetical protein
MLTLALRSFFYEIETIIFNAVQQRSYYNLRVPQAKPLDFAQNKINFVSNFEHWGEVKKMLFGGLFLPACRFDKALNKLRFAGDEVDHPALCVTDQRDASYSADCDGIRNFEFAVPEVCTPRTDNERKIIRNMKMFPIIHAHPDQHVGVGVRVKIPPEIVVLEQKSDRGLPVLRGDVFVRRYRQ